MYGWNYIPKRLRAAVREATARANAQAEGAAYAIYVILDPTQHDPLEQFQAMPIYVGLASNMRRRMETHYNRAALKTVDDNRVCGRMRQLMRKDILARFEVIDRYENEVDALIAETVHAQLLLEAGYRLYNLWPSQSSLLTPERLDERIAAIRRRTADGTNE